MNQDLRKLLRALSPSRLKRIIRFFAPYVRQEWKLVAGAITASVFGVVFMLAQPWPLKMVFDYILYHKKKHAELLPLYDMMSVDKDKGMIIICIAVVSIAILRGVSEYFETLLTHFAGQRVVFRLRAKLFDHIQRLSLRWHNRSNTGDLLMRMTGDIILLREMLVGALVTIIGDVLVVVAMIAVMFYLNPLLTWLSLSILPPLCFITFYYGTRMRQATRRQRRKESAIAIMANETLIGIRAVQGFNRQKIHRKRFEQQNRRSFRQGMRATRLEVIMAQWVEVILSFGTVGVIWYGVKGARKEPPISTPGDLIVYFYYLRTMYKPIRDFSKLASRIAKAAASGERVMDVLRTEPDVQSLPGAIRAPKLQGEIEYENVTFEYDKGRRVLDGIDFHLKPGEKVALVGLSGAGKTSIVSLLPRFYDVTGGSIKLDGHDLREFTLESLRKNVGLVFQDSLLFGTTIFENIAFGRPDASFEEVERAAMRAQAHEFIVKMPRQYQTRIAERGVSLSEGQKQRIAIARAFLKKAPILILDEPTSNVDVKSERAIMRAIQKLIRNTTTIIVTHNLKMISFADRILVIDQGRIVEQGAHEELRNSGGLYSQLLQMHALGYATVEEALQ